MIEVGQTYKFTCPKCEKVKTGLALYGSKVRIQCCGARHTINLRPTPNKEQTNDR